MTQLEICAVMQQWLDEGAAMYDEHGHKNLELSHRTLRGYIQRVGWQLRQAQKEAEPKWKILAVEDLSNVEHPQQS